MEATKIYPQVSKAAAKAKFARMQAGVGVSGRWSFECGFSTWWMGKNCEEEDQFCDEYAIFVTTTYHSTVTLDKMYKTNCKSY